MNPLRLTVRNYRTFAELDLELPGGCVAILGENGAGKSSIVNAIDLAIFGPESRSLADCLSDDAPDGDLLLELEFEHAGQQYRVRRSYSARGRGKTTLDFDWWVDESGEPLLTSAWTPLTRESAKETQALIERVVGLSRDTFRASAFLAQGDGAVFTEAQPRDRKRILAEVLGLDRWDRLLALSRADKTSLQALLLELAGRIGQAEETAAAVPEITRELADNVESETVHADNVADLERSHADLAAKYQQARDDAGIRGAALAELSTVQAELAALAMRNATAEQAARDIVAAIAELDELPTASATDELRGRQTVLAQQVAAHGELARERDFAQRLRVQRERERDVFLQRAADSDGSAAAVRAKIESLRDSESPTCQTCGQALPDDARGRAAASYEDELQRHLAAAAGERAAAGQVEIPAIPAQPAPAPREELAAVSAQLAAISEQETRRATLTERIRNLEAAAGGGPLPDAMVAAHEAVLAKQARVAALGEPPDVAGITTQGELVAQQLRDARAALEQARTMKARLEERLAVATAAARQIADVATDRDRLQTELDVVAQLERAFSPNGIPALIIENSAIPYLETEATRILAELGTAFRVELRTQAELKSGDGLRDTLDVIVSGEHGERPYETFSGGERTRINLALRIALARLLAHRRGAESRLLCVDEPEYLDEQGTAALVDVLRGLEGDFDKLYIVSHVPGLRDSFDTTLAVVNTDGRSAVVEAGIFEAVAA